MKKMIIVSLAFALLTSCSKDKDNTCKLDAASLSGSYRVTAAKYKANATAAEADYYTQLYPDACEKDDIVTLNTNGTYTFTDAGIKCTPPGDDTGTWSFSGNTLTIDGSPENVDSFNCSALVLSASNVMTVGDKLTITLTKQ
jgi:Lipocalin-like domain